MCASRSRGPGGRAGPIVLVSRPPPQELPSLLTATSASWFAARCRSPPSPLRFRGNLGMEREKTSPCLTPHGPKPQTLSGLPHGTSPWDIAPRSAREAGTKDTAPHGATPGGPSMLTRVPLERLGLLLGAGGGGGGSLPTALLVPVLPPAPQLEVDEAPHHRGLEEAHQQQHTHSGKGGEEAG